MDLVLTLGRFTRRDFIRLSAVAFSVFFALPMALAHADAGFDRWVKGFWKTAKAEGISATTYRRAFAGVKPDPTVIKKAERQPEFVTPIWDYLGSAVSERRIRNGKIALQNWESWLDRIEAKYQVDRHVVVAIWGMESSYGEVLDNPKIVRHVVRSLATLAYAGGRRKKFGRQQLIAALKILERGDVAPQHMTGSWAGAMGHTQFIPTTYNAYAVDFDGDGRRNIWRSIPDALASTAAYLKRSRWVSGKTWGYEVRLPRGFNYGLGDNKAKRTLAEWRSHGVLRVNGGRFPRPGDEAYLLLPAGAGGPAFLMLKNFRVIKRYNNADAYALGVGHLADRLRGGEPFRSSWPTADKPLNHSQVVEMQRLLTRHGYSTGGVDGKIGPKTAGAIRSYQHRLGRPSDGYASTILLSLLRNGG